LIAVSKLRTQRGVTLIELMIAVSLVAVISGGMLFAVRTGLAAYEKTDLRLRTNRAAMNTAEILNRQLGGLMPVMGTCNGVPFPMFAGTPQGMFAVSSFSIAEGARGFPQIVEYQVVPSPAGGLRLVVSEQPYTGPASGEAVCTGGQFLPSPITATFFVIADRLASCVFAYHQLNDPRAPQNDPGFVPAWNFPVFPPVIRIDMTPLDGAPLAGSPRLPFFSVTAAIQTDQEFQVQYAGP